MAKACFTALAEADINLEMINQGSSEVSIMFGIDEKDEAKTVKVLYDAFFPAKKTNLNQETGLSHITWEASFWFR